MTSPASAETKSRLGNYIARQWPEILVGLLVLGFFIHFCRRALYVRFALDEMMNMYWYWDAGIWKVGWAGLTFSNKVIRPMGALYYLLLFKAFGFNPLPFNIVRLAVVVIDSLLFFWLAARISGSRMIAAIAAVFMVYHANLGNIVYVGSFIYDAFCAGFYFSAMLYYMRCRSLYGSLNLSRSCVFLGLYVCALHSKEMAVSLPVIVFAYELLYHAPKKWKTPGGAFQAMTDAAPLLAAVAITVVFIAVKTLGPGSLITQQGFQPAYTWTRFFETNSHYLNTIFYTTQFSAGLVLLAWAALLYVAVRNGDRRLLLLWVWVVVTPLPIAFIPGRGGACVYIIAAGWATLVAILVEALARRIAREPVFARLPSRAVVTCLIVAAIALYGYETEWRHYFAERAYLNDGAKTWGVIQQFQRLPIRPTHGSRIVILNDPFPGYDTLFIASLWWHDHSLSIKLQNHEHYSQKDLSSMDYLFDFPDGQLKQLKP